MQNLNPSIIVGMHRNGFVYLSIEGIGKNGIGICFSWFCVYDLLYEEKYTYFLPINIFVVWPKCFISLSCWDW